MPVKSEETGRFMPGNRFWEMRSSAGPKPKFAGPEPLWAACCEYFQWVDATPLWEDKLVTYMGRAIHEPTARMRAMTIHGLCLFLDVSVQAWHNWRQERADLFEVIAQAENVIRSQKFEGAAADLLNANIIARDLGLADKQELSGPDGGAIKVETDIEAARRVAFLLASAANKVED